MVWQAEARRGTVGYGSASHGKARIHLQEIQSGELHDGARRGTVRHGMVLLGKAGCGEARL